MWRARPSITTARPARQLTAGEKQFVQMGARVLILPDKLVFDTQSQQLRAVEAQFSTVGAADVSLCAWDGSDLGRLPSRRRHRRTGRRRPLAGYGQFAPAPLPVCGGQPLLGGAQRYRHPHCSSGHRRAVCGRGWHSISGCENEALNGSHILLEAAQDSIRMEGLLAQSFSQNTALTVCRVCRSWILRWS